MRLLAVVLLLLACSGGGHGKPHPSPLRHANSDELEHTLQSVWHDHALLGEHPLRLVDASPGRWSPTPPHGATGACTTPSLWVLVVGQVGRTFLQTRRNLAAFAEASAPGSVKATKATPP